MDLSRLLENKKLRSLQQEFNEEAWSDFHDKNINTQDEFYEYIHQWIDNAVMYYSECDAILEGNSEYHYDEHELWGKPENVSQAAYACLYDYLMNHTDLVSWCDMEDALIEAELNDIEGQW